MDMDFARITSAVMRGYNWSERELAERLRLSQSTVHRIKTGATKNPGFTIGRQLLELHEALPPKLRSDELAGSAGQPAAADAEQ